MTIYLDLYFVLNFVMDYLLLVLVGWMLLLPVGRKVLVAAMVGAGAACGLVFLPLEWLAGGMKACAALVLEAAAAGIMVRIAYGYRSFRLFVGEMITLYLFGVLTGGIFEAVEQTCLMAAPAGDRSIWTPVRIILMAAGIAAAGRCFMQIGRRWVQLQRQICRVRLHFQGKEQTVNALWDTGNQLYEPYGHQPVHVIAYDVCREWYESAGSVVLIPFCAVGTKAGMMPGIQIDEMDVIREGKVVRHYDKPWLAISRKPLSPQNRYEMLLQVDE